MHTSAKWSLIVIALFLYSFFLFKAAQSDGVSNAMEELSESVKKPGDYLNDLITAMATTKGLICGSTMMPNNSWGFITWALFIVVNLLLVAVGSSLKMYAQDIAVDVYYDYEKSAQLGAWGVLKWILVYGTAKLALLTPLVIMVSYFTLC